MIGSEAGATGSEAVAIGSEAGAIGSEVVTIGSEAGAIGSEPIANVYESGKNCFFIFSYMFWETPPKHFGKFHHTLLVTMGI